MNLPMHPDDYESFNNQSELQNCLSEAMPYAVEKRGPTPHYGEGPVTVTVTEPVFCKSTDGYAGMIISEIRHFFTETAANCWIQEQYTQEPCEFSFQLKNELKTKLLKKIAATYTGWCGNPLAHDWRDTLQNFRSNARKTFKETRNGDYDINFRPTLREAFAAAIFATQCQADSAERSIPF